MNGTIAIGSMVVGIFAGVAAGRILSVVGNRRDEDPPASDGTDDVDPVLAVLSAAPIDDEPVTEDDDRAIAEGWRAYRAGQTISADEAKRSLAGAKDGSDRAIPV